MGRDDTKHVTSAEKRALRARLRFKSAIRFVINNLYWLTQTDEELGEDVKKNVLLLMKKKKDKKDKDLLSYYDKLILIKRAEWRTEEDKQVLNRVIGNLKCFRKYPETVRKQLAAVTFFLYYGPDRVIMRQGGEGQSLYFVASGAVDVSIRIFDPVFSEWKTIVVGTMETGDMFGEISLLHNIPRTATITTKTHTELLVLMKEDFNVVFKASLQKIWDEVLAGMKRFTYFDHWDDVAHRECCIYSKIQEYPKDHVIYGVGGDVRFSHYVHFLLKGHCQIVEELPIIESEINGVRHYKLFDYKAYKTQKKTLSETGPTPSKCQTRYSTKGSSLDDLQMKMIKKQLKHLLSMKSKEKFTDMTYPPYVKKIFMQVAILNELACFGLGEDLAGRSIIAGSDVVCLLIPRYWLFTKNRGNIWGNIALFLNKRIPKTEEVFKLFVLNRKFGEYSRNLVNHVARGYPPNHRKNVPYSIRLTDDIDYGVDYICENKDLR